MGINVRQVGAHVRRWVVDPAAALEQALRRAVDPIPLLDRVAEQVLVAVPEADGATVEMSADAVTLTYVSAAGRLAPYVGTRLPASGSLSGLALRTGELQRSPDTESDPRVDAAACRRLGVASMVCVPLVYAGSPVGVLKISSSVRRGLAAADLTLVVQLADFLSCVVGAAAQVDTEVRDLLRRVPVTPSPRGAAAGVGRAAQVARFVADVLTPGVTEDVAARHRVQSLLDGPGPSIVFQPIVEVATGQIVGHEALARFADGRPPAAWFADAHRGGLSAELELRAAVSALRAYPEHASTYVSINVGPSVLTSPDLLHQLRACQHDRQVVIELTEHAVINDYDDVAAGIGQLRRLGGVRIAVDDVGSGYASLRHVVDLHPDILKIDRSLIATLDEDPARHALAAAFAQLGRAMGWAVVAEGIERDEELAACGRLGISHAQGYLLGRPGPLVLSPTAAVSR